MTRGLYAASPETPSDHQRLWAGHRAGGAGSAIGGRGALFLAGLAEAPETVEIWIPLHSTRADHPRIAFRRDRSDRLVHVIGILPRIRTEEALIDVGRSLDAEPWVALLAEAVRVGTVSVLDGWRCDVRYDAWSLIVELDGCHHLKAVFRDRDRDNRHAVHGSATLRYGSGDFRGRPRAAAEQVATALVRRGWQGRLTRGPRCPTDGSATVKEHGW